MDLLYSAFAWLIAPFVDPAKRVFIGYLLSALLISVIWLRVVQGSSFISNLKTFFKKEFWWTSSTKADYALLIINRLLMALISPWLISQLLIATLLFESMHNFLTPASASDWPIWIPTLLYTLSLFFLDDFSRFALHMCMHRWRFLWRFHQVHHSATSLSPLTVFRTHPVEGILFSLRTALTQGICIAIFVFFFDQSITLMQIFGAHIFVFIFNIAGANLRHSHIPIVYPKWLERWLISPAQHQIHHSILPEHFNKNYGVVLSIWDRFFGSFCHSEKDKKINFGICAKQDPDEHKLTKLYFEPLIGKHFYQSLIKKYRTIISK